jgi:hypothetical protein
MRRTARSSQQAAQLPGRNQYMRQQSASSSKIQTEENKAPTLTTQEQYDFNTT